MFPCAFFESQLPRYDSIYASCIPFPINFLSKKYAFPSFKFLAVQPLPGQHSILKDVWIMMDILLPSPQLTQLQQVGFLLGIGGRPLEMVSF